MTSSTAAATFARVDTEFGSRPGESVTRHGENHHVETLTQKRKNIEELDDRPGPPVDQHQRDGAIVNRWNMQQMHPLSGGSGDKRSPAVEFRFGGSPVVPIAPTVHERSQGRLLGSVIPAGTGEFVGPPGGLEATTQIIQLAIGDIDFEGDQLMHRGHRTSFTCSTRC
jgi:hypothetical protein